VSKRTAFLSGAMVAVVVMLGAWLAAQVWFAPAPSAGAPVVNAQQTGNNPSNPASLPQQQQPTPIQNVLSVSGLGRSSATPDIARLTVGVEAVGPNVGQVVGDVNSKQSAIIAKLKALGVADKDIQTTSYNVNIDRSKPPLPGAPDSGPLTYHASNTAQITVRKLDQLSAILQAAVDAGANNIYGVSMSLSDSSALANDARAKAIADARSKADALAKAAGVKLGRIISISEGPVGAFPPTVFADSRAVPAAAPIEPGELQVQVQVNVVFAIE